MSNFIENIKEYFEGFKACAKREQEFAIKFGSGPLKLEKTAEPPKSGFYFQKFYLYEKENGLLDAHGDVSYYPASEESIREWKKLSNCVGYPEVPHIRSRGVYMEIHLFKRD
jgi:hypothetical protein